MAAMSMDDGDWLPIRWKQSASICARAKMNGLVLWPLRSEGSITAKTVDLNCDLLMPLAQQYVHDPATMRIDCLTAAVDRFYHLSGAPWLKSNMLFLP